MITVLRAGPLTTVQDLGRPGYAHLGVSRSGAADVAALVRANRRVGNPDPAAALEMTLAGATLRFEYPRTLALAGAEMPGTLGGRPIAWETALHAAAGEVLALGPARSGVRAYLAISGGLDVPPVLGSRSTDLLSGLGPAPLKDGDTLAVGGDRGAPSDPGPAPPLDDEPVLRIHPGPREDWFVGGALRTLCQDPYTVSADSNRIGVRLQGAAIARAVAEELPSEGMVPGAIQIPPDGQPVVLMADHPATGGYPVIAVVARADLGALAQTRPGARVRFRPVS